MKVNLGTRFSCRINKRHSLTDDKIAQIKRGANLYSLKTKEEWLDYVGKHFRSLKGQILVNFGSSEEDNIDPALVTFSEVTQYFGKKSSIRRITIEADHTENIRLRIWIYWMEKSHSLFIGDNELPDDYFQKHLNQNVIERIFRHKSPDYYKMGAEGGIRHSIAVKSVRTSQRGNKCRQLELVYEGNWKFSPIIMGAESKIEHNPWWLGLFWMAEKANLSVSQTERDPDTWDKITYRRPIGFLNITDLIKSSVIDLINDELPNNDRTCQRLMKKKYPCVQSDCNTCYFNRIPTDDWEWSQDRFGGSMKSMSSPLHPRMGCLIKNTFIDFEPVHEVNEGIETGDTICTKRGSNVWFGPISGTFNNEDETFTFGRDYDSKFPYAVDDVISLNDYLDEDADLRKVIENSGTNMIIIDDLAPSRFEKEEISDEAEDRDNIDMSIGTRLNIVYAKRWIEEQVRESTPYCNYYIWRTPNGGPYVPPGHAKLISHHWPNLLSIDIGH